VCCESISEGTRRLLDTLMPKPASIQKPNFDIVAWNDSFGHLMGVDFNAIPPEDRNCIYLFLTHPAWRARLGKRDDVLPIFVSYFRAAMAEHRGDPCGKPNWRGSLRCLRSLKPCGTSATMCAVWKISSNCSPILSWRFYSAADVLVFCSAQRIAAAGLSAGG
jgi:hypothetical protein